MAVVAVCVHVVPHKCKVDMVKNILLRLDFKEHIFIQKYSRELFILFSFVIFFVIFLLF